jgi:hypothetical protein
MWKWGIWVNNCLYLTNVPKNVSACNKTYYNEWHSLG